MNFCFGLYPVISSEFCLDRNPVEVLQKVIQGGVKIVQLREKNISKSDLYALALKFKEITHKHQVILIINDHVDIALSVKADGVHLGQDDLPCYAARSIAPHLIIGVSTHSKEEIESAEKEGASYINIGPIFQTNTKTLATPPLGMEYLHQVKPRLPFSVMGGIKENDLQKLLAAGAKNIAMVTEITQADDITKKVKKLNQIIKPYI